MVFQKQESKIATTKVVKRRRRRVRNDDMGNLDISLIKEFARRPAFYDRSNPHFKDKVYAQHAWREISNMLGFDATILKDRMYQLRNRYNLEKRRLENIRNDDPTNPLVSPWPLFNHLKFLDGHIKPRRSYKRMMKRSSSNAEPEVAATPVPTMNGTAATIVYENNVKYETEIESDDEQEVVTEEPNGQRYIDASNFLASESDATSAATRGHYAQYIPNANIIQNTRVNGNANGPVTNGGINVRSLESLKRHLNTDDSSPEDTPAKKSSKVSRFEKFEAFGRFLAVSLCDLSEQRALSLVERFTSDVVQALLEKN